MKQRKGRGDVKRENMKKVKTKGEGRAAYQEGENGIKIMRRKKKENNNGVVPHVPQETSHVIGEIRNFLLISLIMNWFLLSLNVSQSHHGID